MSSRKTLSYEASGSAIALALALLPQTAFAQSTQPTAPQQEDVGRPVTAPEKADAAEGQTPENVIVVTGFRGALQSAVSEKKRSDLILESVAQEDIGKLPDNSIGESIARLPGVTAQRLNGRANVISIRGFGPDFSQTLLNGREQTSLGDARAVEFDQYPAEVVSQVVVYKTPSASLVGQGLVGTVDIRTIRPLEYGKQVFAVGARGSYTDLGKLNAGSKEFGYRANATYVDQFADDTIGIALSASYIDEPYQVQEFNAWGYNTVNGNNVIGGSKSYVTSTQLTRFGLTGTLQFKPTDTITLTADGFYSDFHDDQTKRGIELPLAFDGQNGLSVTDPANNGSRFDPATATASDGLYTSGTFTNVEGVIRNDVFERDAKLYSGGFNALYEGDDGWSAFFDFGYSRTDRHELSLESYSGTGYGRGNGATDTIGFETGTEGTFFDPALNYSNPGLVFLTDPLGWGGSTIQAGYSNDRIVKDELKQYRVQVQREMDGFISAVKVGMNYTDRDKSLTPEESFVLIPGGATEAPIPSQYIVGSTDLTYLGLGPILSYDPRELLANGVLELRPNSVPDVIAKAYTISEDLMTLYGQADIRVPLGTTELTGNFGVQAIGTSQKSSGLTIPNGVFVPVTRGDDYWDVLPSINLSLRFDSGFVIRAAAAREVMRPRLDDLRVAIAYGVTTTVDGQSPTGLYPYLSGSGGNPYLRPYRANAFDLNFEKYFGSSGVIALQLFYKDIKSYVDKSKVPFDFTGFPLPTGQAPATLTGLVDQPANTGSGELYGAELAATVPFDLFTRALDGFGVTGGVGYTETKVLNLLGDETQIPGYSKWVANGTLFFEKYGLNLRGSARYRTGFLGDFTGFGGSPTRRIAKDELIIDAQIGYDFGGSLDGLSVYIQGQNLTDEPFVSLNPGGDPRQVIDYQSFGRRFLAGFTYKF